MNRQAQIDAFLLAAHRLALTRLHGWEALLAAGTPALEAAVGGEIRPCCVASQRVAARHPDHATRARSLARRGAPVVNRRQPEHVFRAAAAMADETAFVVVGSQAVDAPDKDAVHVRVLLKETMIDIATLVHRVGQIDPQRCAVGAVTACAQRRAAEASPA